MRHCITVIILFLVLIIMPKVVNATSCTKLLEGGVFDFHYETTDDVRTVSYLNWFCENRFSSESEADAFGSSLAFPFKGVPIEFGLNASGQTFSEWSDSFCSSVSNDTYNKSTAHRLSRLASEKILNAFNTCIKGNKGLHVWLERTEDRKKFRVYAQFITPSRQLNSVNITKFNPGENVDCKMTVSEVKPWKIRGDSEYIVCTRKNSDAVVIDIDANYDIGDVSGLTLPKLRDTTVSTPTRQQMFDAISRGDLDAVQKFIARGFNVNGWLNEEKVTPLHLAAERCRVEMVKYLLENGADRTARNIYSDTPITIAKARCGGFSSAVYQKLRGNDTVSKEEMFALINSGNSDDVSLALHKGFPVDGFIDSESNRSLHLAAERCYGNIVSILLERNADRNVRNVHNQTPTDIAKWRCGESSAVYQNLVH